MDWNNIRQQWAAQPAPEGQPPGAAALREQAGKLQRTIRRRDLLETIAAVVVVVFFALVAGGAASDGNWMRLGFALLIVIWALYLPFHLRRARRQLPDPQPDLPLRSFLERQRDAALAQARMLEQAWLWYVAPAMVGLVGLTLSEPGAGSDRGALLYIGGSLLFGAFVAWLNRHTAKHTFHAHAQALQSQIEALDGEGRP